MNIATKPYETKIRLADNHHFLSDVDACGHPLVINHLEGLVIPIALYQNFLAARYPASTCLKHARILSVFWDHIRNRGIHYREVNERIVRRFLINNATRDTTVVALKDDAELSITLERAEFACYVIANFYRVLEDEFGYLPKLRKPRFDEKRKLSSAQRTAERTNPATPSVNDVEKVKEHFLERPNTFAGLNMYGMAALFRSAGLRTCGAVSLTTSAMRQAFVGEVDFLPIIRRIPRELSLLAKGVVGTEEMRNLLLSGLKAMRERGRTIVSVPVFEKSQSSFATVPIDDFSDLLDFIWSDRHAFILSYGQRHRDYRPPDNVFLSTKTGRAYDEKSVSNCFSKTMKALGIAGTGHRIRATSIEEQAKSLYYLHRGLHGIAWQPDNILEWLRMYARHSGTGPIVHYINRIINIEEVLGYMPVLFDDADLAASARALAAVDPERKQCAVEGLLALVQELGLKPLDEPNSG
ncbi:hypothetical protein [Rhizobium leguminosarum]